MKIADFQTLDQKRALYASNKIRDIIEESSSDKDFLGKYKTRAKNLSSIIREDLLQGLAFYLSKQHSSDRSFRVVLEQITEWFRLLAKEGYIKVEPEKLTDPHSFIEYLTTLSAYEYLTLTNEALQIGQWFKRFADALIEEEGEE